MDFSLRYVAITMARRERCVVFHASALLLLITALKSLMKSLRAREKQSTLLLFFFFRRGEVASRRELRVRGEK